MNVKLGELVAERVRHRAKASGGLASLLACRRSSDAPAAARPGRLALGMVAPHDVTVVVRGGHAREPIPELRAATRRANRQLPTAERDGPRPAST